MKGVVGMIGNHVEIWEKCLAIIRDNLPEATYKTWFEPIVPVKIENGDLLIQVPSMYYVEYLEEHFISLLKKTLRRVIGPHAKLSYEPIIVKGANDQVTKTVTLPGRNHVDLDNKPIEISLSLEKQKEIKNPFIVPGIQKIKIDSKLNPIYSFENFVEGESNRLARSAGFSVALKPGNTSFNPLFIHGGNGLGKTHLAHAIGIKVKDTNPDLLVLYVNAHQFQQQFTDAIQANEVNDFINFYRMIDVLIIDDVHIFAQGSKPKTQEAFFHIFNYLHQNSKQLVLTCDKSPAELQGLEQRLLSRFKWGLVAELTTPDFDTRLAILKHRLRRDGIEINSEVQRYIAKQVATNIRELEGALVSLLAHATLNKSEVTIDLARDVLDKLVSTTRKKITIESIQNAVCSYFKIPVDEIKGRSRKREIVLVRQISMYFAKELTKDSLASIGKNIGGRDHATVLHACKSVKDMMEIDRNFRQSLLDIERILKG
ncbi:MAG TPA: chromosomal replication initiator protein DnaA [Salinivirgaceae bacterium]|nr:chromosomal replication initiator protein DnaA [Salinivirgaceae bacterium]